MEKNLEDNFKDFIKNPRTKGYILACRAVGRPVTDDELRACGRWHSDFLNRDFCLFRQIIDTAFLCYSSIPEDRKIDYSFNGAGKFGSKEKLEKELELNLQFLLSLEEEERKREGGCVNITDALVYLSYT